MILADNVLEELCGKIVSTISGAALPGTTEYLFGILFQNQISEARAAGEVSVDGFLIIAEAAYQAARWVENSALTERDELHEKLFDPVLVCTRALDERLESEMAWILIDGCIKDDRIKAVRQMSDSLAIRWERDQAIRIPDDPPDLSL